MGLIQDLVFKKKPYRFRERKAVPPAAGDYHGFRRDLDDVFTLDDRTWRDLDMDQVFALMNRTFTAPGEQVLYDLMRCPLQDRQSLTERYVLIAACGSDRSALDALRRALDDLGYDDGESLADMLWRPAKEREQGAWMYQAAFLLLCAIPFSLFISIPLGIFLFVASYATNIWLHYRLKKRIWYELPTTTYLGRMLRAALRIAQLKMEFFKEQMDTCAKAAKATKSLRRKLVFTTLLGSNTAEDLLSMLKVSLLAEARAYFSSRRGIDKHRLLLQDTFRAIGYLDAVQSIVAYRSQQTKHCDPVFVPEQTRIIAKEAYHPLLSSPVPNDYALSWAGLVVTGSNMSGKTTFLRTVGINAVFAQTILTVFAASYTSGIWRPISAIGRADNLIEGKSYYLDEALAVLRIVKNTQGNQPCLCLLDELFRGTNSKERVAAAVSTIRFLQREGCCTLLATHDLEIVALVRGEYENGHFEEDVEQEGLCFNYKLLSGPAHRTNALEVLRFVGFPMEIIDEARILAGAGD